MSDKRPVKKYIAVIAGILFLGALAAFFWSNLHSDAAFTPKTSRSEINENQVRFDEEDDYSFDKDTSDDSSLWNDENDDAEDPERTDSGYLYKENQKNLSIYDPQSENVTEDHTSGSGISAVAGEEGETAKKIKAGKGSADKQTTGGKKQQTKKKQGDGGNGSDDNGSGDPGNASDTPDNTTRKEETTSDDDRKNSSKKDTTEEEKKDSDETPKETLDPDPTPSRQPVSDVGTDVPETGLTATDDPDRYSFLIIAFADDQFYYGESLDEKKIWYAAVYYILDGETGEIYHIPYSTYSDYFQIVDYPETVEGDTVTVTFLFTPTKTVSKTVTWEFTNVYDCKLLIKAAGNCTHADAQDYPGYYDVEYLSLGDSIDLDSGLRLYYALEDIVNLDDITDADGKVSTQKFYYENPRTNAIFLGWSETEGGTLVSDSYVMSHKGYQFIYPVYADLPEGYTARLLYDDGTFSQMITAVPEESDWVIPEGIERIRLGYTKQDVHSVVPSSEEVGKTISIPSTVTDIALETLNVWDSYEVAADNAVYASEDGILMNQEKTAILGIPLHRTSLTVGASVTQVVLSAANELNEIHIEGSSVPEKMDISLLKEGTKVIVPYEAKETFADAWGSAENITLVTVDAEGNEIVLPETKAEEGTTEPTTEEQGTEPTTEGQTTEEPSTGQTTEEQTGKETAPEDSGEGGREENTADEANAASLREENPSETEPAKQADTANEENAADGTEETTENTETTGKTQKDDGEEAGKDAPVTTEEEPPEGSKEQ